VRISHNALTVAINLTHPPTGRDNSTTMPRIELRLPDLGMDDQPMTLSAWLVPSGARVTAGERVAEILAGPATFDLPSPVDGLILRRLVDEDESIVVGQALAVIETSS
jgi:pyruvate/2-oxoglutarate dehydrogenase complex dihydrolipoamide acyltransferase (E2) component